MNDKISITKNVSPPPDLPIYGQIRPQEVNFFGRTNYESEFEAKKFIFGIKRNDRRRHFYIIGKSDTGKTKLIELLARQDIALGYGLAIFDPDGNIIEDLLNFIPQKRIEDVVFVDPTNSRYELAFNPLKNLTAETKHNLGQIFIDIIKKNFNSHNHQLDPQSEHLLRYSVLALLDYPSATLTQLIPLLTDKEFRQEIINHCQNKMVKNFWEKEFPGWSQEFASKIIAPLLNKLTQLLHNPYLFKIFQKEENKIDFKKIINERKIFLVNLAKSKLGNEAAGFWGSLILAKIYQACLESSLESKQDFYIYLDDFHNFADKTLLNFLEVAKRNRFSFTLSHQNRGQIDSLILANILSHVATTALFRVNSDDAAILEKEMSPTFRAKDMINLGNREFYIKMSIDQNISDPFSAETLKILPPPYESSKEKIIEYNCQQYGAKL